MLKSFQIHTYENGTLGLHLTRAPWDPYPWISSIQTDSSAYAAGLRIGDTVLEFNSCDILGLKISEIALLLKSHWLQDTRVNGNTNNSKDNNSETDNDDNCHCVTMVVWRNETQASVVHETHNKDCNAKDQDAENNAHNINQQSLQKFATCLQHIAQLLECPVCLEVIKPPGWQCCNGHVLCNNCRSRSVKCPVCRVPLGPRGRCLLSDKLFTLLAESFPCDGVRSNKNSPKERRKCSPEIHNHPKMAVDVMQRKKKDQQRRQQDFDAKDKNKAKQQQQQQQLQEKEQNQEEQQEHRQLRNADISGVCLSFRTRCASSEVHQMKKTLKQSSLASQVKNGQQKEKENEKEKDAVGDQKSKVSLEAIHDKNVHFVKDKIKSVSNSGNSSPDYAADELMVPRVTTPSSSSSSSSSLSSSSPLSLQLSSSSFCSTLIPTTTISTTTVTLTTQVNQITDRECDDLLVQHQHPYQKRKQQSTIVTNINSKQGFCASTCSYFCRCCKQDKVPTVNNGVITTKTAAAAAVAQNEFIYPSIIKATTEQAYQNYQCPTGKLCCLKYVLSCTKATDVSATAGTCRRNSFTFAAHNQMTNNHLSTTTTTTTTKGQQQITRESTPTNHSNSSTSSSSLLLSLSSSSPSSSSPSSLPSSLSLSLSCEGIGDDIGIGLNDEWEILMHLGRDHLIHVCHHYAEYGQRIAMQLPPAYSNNSNDCNKSNYCNKSIICLNFKGVTTTNIIEKFFITCIPLALEQEPQQQIQQQQQQQEQQQYEQLLENKTFPSTCITSSNLKKYAIFLWYLNPKHSLNYHSPVSSNDEDDDVSNFESIIEIPNTDIKWFGRVHHLTTPWSQILASREFLMYDAISDGYDEAFVIVNKMK